jgi:C-terminal processing protease CtpA/Prc
MMKKLFLIAVLAGSLIARAQTTDTVLTDAKKIYGLSRFWQEANYNYAYFANVPNLNWDSAYQAFIPQVLAAKTNYEYYRLLQKFCALLKDGHTNVYFPDYITSKRARRSFGDIKLELRNISGKAIVTNTAAPTKDIIPIGSEITEVNGMPIATFTEQYVRPYISQSASYMIDDYCVDYLLDGFLGDTMRIGYKKPGGKQTQSLLLKREVKQDVAWLNSSSNTLFQLTWLPGEIAKIDLNSFGNRKIVDTFLTALPALQKAKGIIIDLRQNGGGSSDHGATILSYFTDSAIIRGSKWWTREHRAAFKAWGTYMMQDSTQKGEWADNARNYYKGIVWHEGGQMFTANDAPKEKRLSKTPLVVLFGHGTASAAEDFLIMLDDLRDRATTIGQRTFASTGQPMPFNLPGGGSARICTKKDTYPDGRIFVGVGIAPQIEITPTVDDYLKGRDAVVEKAVEVLRK